MLLASPQVVPVLIIQEPNFDFQDSSLSLTLKNEQTKQMLSQIQNGLVFGLINTFRVAFFSPCMWGSDGDGRRNYKKCTSFANKIRNKRT